MKLIEDKKVSIVLPVYNGAAHIVKSIDSIIAQTYQNWELIIVNDCSTDNTFEICNGYVAKDSRIKLISNPVNLKLPNSLNVGFDHATGDFFTWTSDDNMYRPNAIEVLVKTLNNNPDFVMVYSDYTNIDGNGNVIGKALMSEPQFIVTGNVCGACFLYTSEVAKYVGRYDANLFLAEDYDYWMRIYRYGKVKHITDDLYLYRRHVGSLTETRRASIQDQTYRAIEKNFLPLYFYAKKHDLTNEFFLHMIMRAQSHAEETKDMLISINKSFKHYLARQALKESIKAKIRSAISFMRLRSNKGNSR